MAKKVIVAGRKDNGSGSVFPVRYADEAHKQPILYRATIMDGYRDDGRKNIVTFYGKTEAEARRKLDSYIAKNMLLNSSNRVEPNLIVVGKALQYWLTNDRVDALKATSFSRLKCTIDNQILPYDIANLTLDKLDANAVRRWINQLINDYQVRGYSTVKKAYEALRACYKYLAQREFISYNPAIFSYTLKQERFTVPQSSAGTTELRYFTEDEANKIIDVAISKRSNGSYVFRLGQAYNLLLNTGLRGAELCGLHWNDVIYNRDESGNITSGKIVIRATVVAANVTDENGEVKRKKIYQSSTKTKSGTREVPLNAQAVEALTELFKITGDNKNNPNNLVVAGRNGEMFDSSSLDHTFRRILSQAGLRDYKNYGIHSLRHTFATLLFNKDVPVKTVSYLLGHSNVQVTMNTYIHVIPQKQQEAVDLIPQLGTKTSK